MNPFPILHRHYDPSSELYRLLAVHSVLVTQKAIVLALGYQERHPDAVIDLDLLHEAGMLHDIGIKLCHAPEIFCVGPEPYIRHGILGQALLEAEGLPRHALFCSRHTGSGLTRQDVIEQELPLPREDFLPESLEEKILCVADKFYSKTPEKLWKEKRLENISKAIAKHGSAAQERWEELRQEILGC